MSEKNMKFDEFLIEFLLLLSGAFVDNVITNLKGRHLSLFVVLST